MARGDGKATKGKTKGKMLGAKRMATGGFAASSREGGFAGAGASRLESPGQRSSVSPGAGNISAGRVAVGDGGGGRNDPRNAVSNAIRGDYLTNPTRASVRLGPNAAQAMADAGANPDTAIYAAQRINSLSGIQRPQKEIYDRITPDAEIPPPAKQIYDRILPERIYPSAAPASTLGSFTPPATRSITPAASPASPYGTPGFRSGYVDQQSIVPGSVSFKQASKFTPFAETPTGQELLAMSKKPMTAEQAKALQEKFPPGSAFYAQPGKGIFDLQNVAAAQYPAPKNLSGLDTYPATIGGYKFNVGIPKTAGSNVPYGPKIGQYNPKAQVAAPLTGYTGQEQRFAPAPAVRGQEQRFAPAPNSGGTKSVQPAKTTSNVVAGRQNFGPSTGPLGRLPIGGGGEGPRRKKKKPIVEEETVAAKSGGFISRGDGKASRGKTKGRYI